MLKDNAAWSGFSFLVGFLIVFRTSQSYNRFWDGCTSTHEMRAEWFDGCSSLLAFCRFSEAPEGDISTFQNTLVRLFSMLHSAALAEIEDTSSPDVEDVESFKFELIDIDGIDPACILAIRDCEAKVELIFQWIQLLIVEHIRTGVLSIPAPILSRSFQEIATGMVAFHDALKISQIPFPFPYAQTCDFLLVLHFCVVPFVISQWCDQIVWAFVFSFIQVFILWVLNMIAVELENPFGHDANDIDGREMQREMNTLLMLLMSSDAQNPPKLSTNCLNLRGHNVSRMPLNRCKSFCQTWSELSGGATPVVNHRVSVNQWAMDVEEKKNKGRQSLGSNTDSRASRKSWVSQHGYTTAPSRTADFEIVDSMQDSPRDGQDANHALAQKKPSMGRSISFLSDLGSGTNSDGAFASERSQASLQEPVRTSRESTTELPEEPRTTSIPLSAIEAATEGYPTGPDVLNREQSTPRTDDCGFCAGGGGRDAGRTPQQSENLGVERYSTDQADRQRPQRIPRLNGDVQDPQGNSNDVNERGTAQRRSGSDASDAEYRRADQL